MKNETKTVLTHTIKNGNISKHEHSTQMREGAEGRREGGKEGGRHGGRENE